MICLCAGVEAGAQLLASVVSSGTLGILMKAPSAAIRAAAASTITKLSIKAKALTSESEEVAQILNTALAVLKAANQPGSHILSQDTSTQGNMCLLRE